MNQKSKSQLAPYPKPLKRPPPNLDVTMPADNPLAKAAASPRLERKSDLKKIEKRKVRLLDLINSKLSKLIVTAIKRMIFYY